MIIFLDTSAWVKYFLQEEGTLRVQRYFLGWSHSKKNIFAISAVTYAEMMATLKRACNAQRISEDHLEQMLVEFKQQWDRAEVVAVTTQLMERSGTLAKDYSLRGCDAFQLASALETQSTILIGCDQELNQAAKQCGLQVWDPAQEELAEEVANTLALSEDLASEVIDLLPTEEPPLSTEKASSAEETNA